MVMQPRGQHVAQPGALAPAARTNSTTPRESCAGSVLGIATTAVNPPSAAARLPVSIVSASSRPGSRRWTWRSTKPGATTQPAASSTSSPSAGRGRSPTSAITAVVDATSADALAGLVERPSRRVITRRGHAHASLSRSRPSRAGRTAPPCAPRRRWSPAAVITAPGSSAGSTSHLDAAVHRAGVHHQRVLARAARPARRSARSASCTRAGSAASASSIRSRCIRSR